MQFAPGDGDAGVEVIDFGGAKGNGLEVLARSRLHLDPPQLLPLFCHPLPQPALVRRCHVTPNHVTLCRFKLLSLDVSCHATYFHHVPA